MITRTVRFFAVGAAAGVLLAGCGGGGTKEETKMPEVKSSVSKAPAPAPAAAAPAGWKQITNPQAGFSVALPKTWAGVDLTAGDVKAGLKKAGLSGASLAAQEAAVSGLKQQKAMFAFDKASAATGFVTNFNGFCMPGEGVTSAMLKEQLAPQLKQVGALGLKVKETTIAGNPALSTNYTMKSALGPLASLQAQIMADGKVCTLTITGLKGKIPANAPKIFETFKAI